MKQPMLENDQYKSVVEAIKYGNNELNKSINERKKVFFEVPLPDF